MGDRGDFAPRITAKLDVANYLSWSHEVEYALRYRDLWGLVVAEDSCGGGADASGDAKQDAAALGVCREDGGRWKQRGRQDGAGGG